MLRIIQNKNLKSTLTLIFLTLHIKFAIYPQPFFLSHWSGTPSPEQQHLLLDLVAYCIPLSICWSFVVSRKQNLVCKQCIRQNDLRKQTQSRIWQRLLPSSNVHPMLSLPSQNETSKLRGSRGREEMLIPDIIIFSVTSQGHSKRRFSSPSKLNHWLNQQMKMESQLYFPYLENWVPSFRKHPDSILPSSLTTLQSIPHTADFGILLSQCHHINCSKVPNSFLCLSTLNCDIGELTPLPPAELFQALFMLTPLYPKIKWCMASILETKMAAI